MNKHFVFVACVLSQCSFSNEPIKSLKEITLDFIFNPKTWLETKEKTTQDFKEGKYNIPYLLCNRTFKDLDCSGMHFRGIDFTGSTFYNIILKETDLTDAIFHESKFIDSKDLEEAILYLPLDDLNQPIVDQAFKLKNAEDHREILKQYSELRNQIEDPQVSEKDKELLEKHVESLNKIFPSLYLNLKDKNLQNFNLNKMNFEHVRLGGTQFQGAHLENVQFQNIYFLNVDFRDAHLKNAKFPNSNFQKVDLRNAHLESAWLQNVKFHLVKLQGAYLRNARFEKAELLSIELQGAYLENVQIQDTSFESIDLRDAHLENVKFQNVDLFSVKFQGAYLENAQFDNTDCYMIYIQGAHLSKNVIVPAYDENNRTELFDRWISGSLEEQAAYQKLFNKNFNLIKGVEPNSLRAGLEQKNKLGVDLGNSYLMEADLQGIHLENAQLQNADLSCSDLRNAKLQNANLCKANLEMADMRGSNLGGAILDESYSLPQSCTDENILDLYKLCKNNKAKALLEKILRAKRIPIE